jgi:AcrR family transcriptional regulator
MPRPSQKHIILQAALSCFADLGYDGTRIHHIAQKAGVSEGALYKHYPSKEALAQELYQQHLSRFSELLLKIENSSLSVKEKLLEVIGLLLISYREEPDATYFILEKPDFMPELPRGTVYPLDVVERIVHKGQDEASIRPGQPNLVAAIFLGCVLRPIIVAKTSDPGALELLTHTEYDQIILDCAWSAICYPFGDISL